MPRHRPGTSRLTFRRFLVASLLALLIAGCASQQAYRAGKDLIAQDQIEEGLLKFKEAITRDPTNAEYRAAFLQTRDRATSRFLEQADRELDDGKANLALKDFRRVLSIDPANERARAGMRTVETNARHASLLQTAGIDVEKKEYEAARQKLSTILTERPNHEGTRHLLETVMEKLAPAPADSALSAAFRQPISIEFRDAQLKQVFEVIARRSGLNFVFDKDIKTDLKTSIILKNSTVERAVYFLLVTNQLEQQVVDGNTILIYPSVAAKLKEYQEMAVKVFFLAHADAKLMANTLRTILKTRDLVVDEKLNLLIMRDSPEAIRLAERLVNVQDVPESEVMLEVEILEIKRSRLMDLGVVWPMSVSLSPLKAGGGTTLTVADLQNLNSGSIGVSGLGLKVNANKTDSDTNLLANPRIRVRNHEKAKILIGDKVPVITTTISPGTGGFASETVSYVDVGLTLNVEPTIYLNNEVAIRISLEVSNLVNQIQTKSGTVAYQIGTRQASTMLQLKDGENQVLAGLINNEDRSAGDKVPGLGDLPLLGRLFGSTHDDKQKTELVLSITPRLVRNVQRPEAAVSEFSAGTEGSFRRRPDMSVKALAQLPPPVPGNVVVRTGEAPFQAAPSQPAKATVSAPEPVQDAPPPLIAEVPAPETGAVPMSSGQPVPLRPAPVQLSSGQPIPVGQSSAQPVQPVTSGAALK